MPKRRVAKKKSGVSSSMNVREMVSKRRSRTGINSSLEDIKEVKPRRFNESTSSMPCVEQLEG